MRRTPRPTAAGTNDLTKVENVFQLGGIRLGTLDAPGPGVRVAFVDTGAGLRFTIALDRGGDIIDASYNQFGLAYLTPNGLLPPSPAYSIGNAWVDGWAGGLLTTCGPQYIGGARVEDGVQTSLHGTYSQQVATIETVRNPDAREERREMELGLVVRDARIFGPSYEIRRSIRCTLGEPAITIEDEVINIGETRVAHHWLYHCNFGYPLLDRGARFIYRGPAEYWVIPAPPGEDIVQPLGAAAINRLKRVPGPLAEHAGAAERGLIVQPPPDRAGDAHVGLINPALKLGVELSYPAKALPRVANWQHFGAHGCYATALEAFSGSLLGSARDKHPLARPTLAPGESRRYRLQLRIRDGAAAIRELAKHDGAVTGNR